MKFIRLAFLFVALAACAPATDQPSSDKRASSSSERVVKQLNRENQVMVIKVVVYSSRERLQEAYKRSNVGAPGNERVEGFAQWNPDNNSCIIYVSKVEWVRDSEMGTWGHELAHCIYGSFHTSPH